MRIPPPALRPGFTAPLQPAVVQVDDSNFQAELRGYKGAVLIDFYSKLCGPCQRTAPIVDSLAEEFRGQVKVVKIDCDKAPGLVQHFAVTGLPSLMMFNGGAMVHRHVGEPSRDLLKSWMLSAK